MCSLYALITVCGFRAFCHTHNLFHYTESQVRSGLAAHWMQNDWFQSFQSQLRRSGTFFAGHSVLPRVRVTFQRCRRDALDTFAALWSYRAASVLLATTSRREVEVNCEYWILRNRRNKLAMVGRMFTIQSQKNSPQTKANYRRLPVRNCNHSVAHSVTCKQWQSPVSKTKPTQNWKKNRRTKKVPKNHHLGQKHHRIPSFISLKPLQTKHFTSFSLIK